MSAPQPRRYRVNPIETMIFTVSVLVFGHSAYQLLDAGPELKASALSPNHERPSVQDRSPASLSGKAEETPERLMTYALDCSTAGETVTTLSAAKIRLKGTLCPGSQASIRSVSISIGGKPSPAEVFVDPRQQTFTTTYFTLSPGENSVQVEFQYGDEGSESQRISKQLRFNQL